MATVSRREFLHRTSGAATALGVGGLLSPAPQVHAAGSDVIRVGLIGCGGRGTGAAVQAMNTGPDVRIVALGDMFEDRLKSCRKILQNEGKDRCAVDDSHCFHGFDAYKQVIDSGVDVVLHAEPPHFRPKHLEASVAAGKHVFVEKPVAVDAPGVRRVEAVCQEAAKKRLSIVSGLMLHYEPSMQAVVEQVHQGKIGDLISLQCNYNVGGLWVRPRQPHWSDMEYHLRNWYYFTWLSGDHIVEQFVHCLDLIAWVMKGQYPLRANGMGGRQARVQPEYGHIFDHHAVVYDFPNDIRCFTFCRQQNNTHNDISNWAFGTRGTADLMNRKITGVNAWTYPTPPKEPRSRNPWGGHQEEQTALFASIRAGKPINNSDYMIKSTLMAVMGRMATYTGKEITWEQAWNSKEDLTPARYEFGPLPTPVVAIPGVTKFI